MIDYENDLVWTPLNPKTGVPVWGTMGTLADCRRSHPTIPHARWDAEARQWVIAPPAPVEVTGVPSRWIVSDVHRDFEDCAGHTSIKDAIACAEHLAKEFPLDAPFSVEACIPVPRNEDG